MKYKNKINFEDYLLSIQFTKDVINSNLDKFYMRRQTNKFKIFSDILLGKVCEFVVSYELDGCSEPDLRIYPSKKKSFDADLVAKGFNIHVKSCLESSSFETSWLFQPEDDLTINPSSKDLLALCVINDNYEVKFDIVKAKDMVGKYKDPLKKELNKKVIYYKDFL